MAPADMTRRIWQAALAVVVLLTIAVAAEARPKIFVDGFYTQAKEKAKKENKLLVIDFISDPCPPCLMMDQQTWVDPAVEKWMGENAVALQLDRDRDKQAADMYKVRATPTIIVVRPEDQSKEFDRHAGGMKAETLLEWLEGTKNGIRSVDKLKQLVDEAAAKKDPIAEAMARMDMVTQLVAGSKYSDATEHLVWLWDNISRDSVESDNVRLSFVSSNAAEVAEHDEASKNRFKQLRDQSEQTDRLGWVFLNLALKDDAKILQWFDTAKTDRSQAKIIERAQPSLEPLLIRNWRFYDAAVYLGSTPIIFIFFAISGITIALLAVFLGPKLKANWKNAAETNWLKPPTNPGPESSWIAGLWQGGYEFSKSVPVESLGKGFSATLNYSGGVISGHIIDSYGEAVVEGISDYPKLRFRKQYSRGAGEAASIYYEGRFTSEDKLEGRWYDPARPKLSGNWVMTRIKKTAPVE